jgi:hypothetical protein
LRPFRGFRLNVVSRTAIPVGHLEKSPGFFGDLTPQEKPQKSRPTDKKYPENRVFDTRKYGFLGIVCR